MVTHRTHRFALPAFDQAERRLRLPALAVQLLRESPAHHRAVVARWHSRCAAADLRRNDRHSRRRESCHAARQQSPGRHGDFFTDDDRRFYLKTLREQAERFDLTVTGYCLMTNHVHLIVTPREADSLARAVGTTHLIYSQYVNRLHGRSGHLWQNRFYSCPLDGEHEAAAVRYAERNPVRAGMVRSPWRYRWSSAAAHIGERDQTGLLDLAKWRRRYGPDAWKKMLGDPLDEKMVERLRGGIARGRPLGSDRFIAKLEARRAGFHPAANVGRYRHTRWLAAG